MLYIVTFPSFFLFHFCPFLSHSVLYCHFPSYSFPFLSFFVLYFPIHSHPQAFFHFSFSHISFHILSFPFIFLISYPLFAYLSFSVSSYPIPIRTMCFPFLPVPSIHLFSHKQITSVLLMSPLCVPSPLFLFLQMFHLHPADLCSFAC